MDQESCNQLERNWKKCCVARGGCAQREIAWVKHSWGLSTLLSGSTSGAALRDAPEPPRHISSTEGPRLWAAAFLCKCQAVTPPCQSAADARPVLLLSLRPFWHFSATQCRAGEGKLGQRPGLPVFPLCAAVLPGKAAMGGWAGTQPCKPGLSWLSPSRRLSQTGLNDQLLHRQWVRSHLWLLALSTQTRLTEAMTGSTGLLHTVSKTGHVAWYGPCEALIVKASQVFTAFGLKTELYKRRM